MAAGVGGAAMPSWKGAIPEENLWALTYYVQSLVVMHAPPPPATFSNGCVTRKAQE